MVKSEDYLGKRGFKPSRDSLISLVKIEVSDAVIRELRKLNPDWSKKRLEKEAFKKACSAYAAESSTGTWTRVYEGKNSGERLAYKYRAIAYDLDYKRKMFKVAYPKELFEAGNMSGLLSGVTGNIAGMKIIKALRIMDIRFPKALIKNFLGPRYGINGLKKLLDKTGPYLATVPKPKIGRTAEEQLLLARELFTAGDGSYDAIKDDENLVSLEFNDFYKRARGILKEIKKIEKKTNNRKLYICNITHSNLFEMVKRANVIKRYGGRVMMVDVVTTGFAAVDSLRRMNLGLAIYAHRAMHGFITRDDFPGVHGEGRIGGFSISFIVLAKIFRLLGVDFLHGGSPLAKMEDYGEAEYIRHVLQDKVTLPHEKIPSLGQEWYHIKPVIMVASGGLHPGDFEYVISKLGKDIVIQCGGGVLGHPRGIKAGVIAAIQARELALKKIPFKRWIKENPSSELAYAVKEWGYGPHLVY